MRILSSAQFWKGPHVKIYFQGRRVQEAQGKLHEGFRRYKSLMKLSVDTKLNSRGPQSWFVFRQHTYLLIVSSPFVLFRTSRNPLYPTEDVLQVVFSVESRCLFELLYTVPALSPFNIRNHLFGTSRFSRETCGSLYPKKQGVLPNVFPGISISRALYLTEDESYRTRDGVAKSLRFVLSDYFPINTLEYSVLYIFKG